MSTYYTKWTDDALLEEAKRREIIGADRLTPAEMVIELQNRESRIKAISILAVAFLLLNLAALGLHALDASFFEGDLIIPLAWFSASHILLAGLIGLSDGVIMVSLFYLFRL